MSDVGSHQASDNQVIYTVGHSTRSFDEFTHLLKAHGVVTLADVRRYPRSRRLPHFNDTALAENLPRIGIDYAPLPALGGRRKANADSINTGWKNESFRGYADYAQTDEFRHALEELIALGSRRSTAFMCAEALPWQCHRSLIADALLARGWDVRDIFSDTVAKPHQLPKFARVAGTRVTYPSPDEGLFQDV